MVSTGWGYGCTGYGLNTFCGILGSELKKEWGFTGYCAKYGLAIKKNRVNTDCYILHNRLHKYRL
jgi:hypothetical protein